MPVYCKCSKSFRLVLKLYNVSLKFVQEQLGHSTLVTTMTTYSHVMSSVSEQAMDLLERLECEQNMSKSITQKSKKPLLQGLFKWSG